MATMREENETAEILRKLLGDCRVIYTVRVPHAGESNYYRVFAIVTEDGNRERREKPQSRLIDIALYIRRVTGMNGPTTGQYQGCIKGRSISPEDIASNLGLYLYDDYKKVTVERM